MNPINYFKGVYKQAKKIRWPKREIFIPTVTVVVIISVVASLFLVLEDLASGVLIEQLAEAFKTII